MKAMKDDSLLVKKLKRMVLNGYTDDILFVTEDFEEKEFGYVKKKDFLDWVFEVLVEEGLVE